MKTVPLEDNKWRVFLDTQEYRQLLKHAYSNSRRSVEQVRIQMRLMACSLRVDTASGLRYGQFEKRETPEGEFWVVTVEGKDSTEREAETRPRAVFVPDGLMERIHRYARRHNKGPEDKLFTCSTRTIQRDVKRSANNAATATGNEQFRKVSAHDLRRYFATHLLFRHQVRPAVVRMLGGWKSDESMYEYLVLPDDVLFTQLGDSGLLGTSYDKLHQRNTAEKIEAATSRLADLVADANQDEVETAAGQMKELFENIESITVDVETGEHIPSDEEPDTDQMSFQQFKSDETGVASPAAMAKIAYYACVVVCSWSATFGTLG